MGFLPHPFGPFLLLRVRDGRSLPISADGGLPEMHLLCS